MVRRIVIGIAAVVSAAVLIDFSAAAYAEYRVSRALRVGAALSADPQVTFHGFPFLGQAAEGSYRDVEIRARELRPDLVGGEVYVEASLHEVSMPLRRLVDGTVRSVTAGKVDSRTRIGATELGPLLELPDLEISTAPADRSDGSGGSGGSGITTAGVMVLMATVPIASTGTVKRVSVEATPLLEGNRLRIVADRLYAGHPKEGPDTPVADIDLPTVLARFSRTIDLRQLPFRLAPTEVTTQGGQIVVEGTAENLTLSLDQLEHPTDRTTRIAG